MLDKNPATRITWAEIIKHPFNQHSMRPRELPAEPALEDFVTRNNLRPEPEQDPRASMAAAIRAAADLRGSVDVTRLSQIAGRNIRQDGTNDTGGEYRERSDARAGVARGAAQQGAVPIDDADVEVDFAQRATPEPPSDAAPSATAAAAADARPANAALDRQQSRGSAIPSSPASTSSLPRAGSLPPQPDANSATASAAPTPTGNATPRIPPHRAASERGGSERGQDAAGADAKPMSAGGPGAPRDTITPLLGINPRQDRKGMAEQASAMQIGGAGAAGPGVRENIASLGAGRPGGACLEDVIWHASDMVVKPIVGNRRIERVPEPRWDAAALPFRPLTLQEMIMAPAQQLEGFLQQVYKALASGASVTDKANILAYFESLCIDSQAANILVNSSLMALLVRLLRAAKSDKLRTRIPSVMGLLVRHATYIADELASTGIVEALAEVLRDKGERVRRRAMAALGELLFYLSTQQHHTGALASDGDGDGEGTNQGDDSDGVATPRAAGGAATRWDVPPIVTAQVLRLLRQGEDDVTQHYALKTIENIATQGGEWAARFATKEAAFCCAQVLLNSNQDTVRGTAASTLARLVRAHPALLPYTIEKFGLRTLVQGLLDTSSKSQGACATMLALALASPDVPVRATAGALEDRTLQQGLAQLLDSPLQMLQGKGVVILGLLARQGFAHLARAGKVVEKMERLSRERDPYVRAALRCLQAEVRHQVSAILLPRCTQELAASQGGRRAASPALGRAASRGGALASFSVVPYLLQSPTLRPAVQSAALVSHLAAFLRAVTAPGAASAGPPEFKEAVLRALDALSESPTAVMGLDSAGQTKALEDQLSRVELVDNAAAPGDSAPPEQPRQGPGSLPHAAAHDLIPALADVVASQTEGGDARYSALALLADLLLAHLAARPPQQRAESAQGGRLARDAPPPPGPPEADAVDAALTSVVLPLLPTLLEGQESDMIPLCALKVLVALVESAPAVWAPRVAALQIVPRLFSFLSLDHPNNNVHNMRLCRALVVFGALTCEQAAQLRAVERVEQVLVYAHENAVEPFLDPALDLCCSLLERDQHATHAGEPGAGITRGLVSALPVLVDLVRHPDSGIGKLAAECLGFLCDLFPADASVVLLSEEFALALAGCLDLGQEEGGGVDDAGMGGGFGVEASVQESLLVALSCVQPVGLPVEGPEVDALAALLAQAEVLSRRGEGAVREAASQAVLSLSAVLQARGG
ncbi:unnamed protein product [Pedinophyceae sp. YPF-701]|nr:unnamed protein product [Pedinophyceae sp. YPF-701]